MTATRSSQTLLIEPLRPELATTAWRTLVDPDGGAPLRCCLRDSRPGERITLASVTPPGPAGAYAETGPVFLHADGCAGPVSDGYPAEFRSRRQIFRAYGHDGALLGGELVEPGEGQEAIAERLLADPAVAFLHSRNVIHGCYMFAIRRAGGAGAVAASKGKHETPRSETMTTPDAPDPDTDDLGVIPPQEQVPRDRHFHGKQPPRLSDEELARRTEHERVTAGLEDYDPNEVPPATD